MHITEKLGYSHDGVKLVGLRLGNSALPTRELCRLCFLFPSERHLGVEPTEVLPKSGCSFDYCFCVDLLVPESALERVKAKLEKLEAECHTQS